VTTHFFKVASTLLSGTTATLAAAYGDALVLTPTTVSPAARPTAPSWRKAMRTFLHLLKMTLCATSQPAAFLSNHTSSGLRSKVLRNWKELVDLCHSQSPPCCQKACIHSTSASVTQSWFQVLRIHTLGGFTTRWPLLLQAAFETTNPAGSIPLSNGTISLISGSAYPCEGLSLHPQCRPPVSSLASSWKSCHFVGPCSGLDHCRAYSS
jgi:hypothetical protein